MLIVVDLSYLHVYGRALGAGIGLLLVPLLAALFTSWVDGDVLYYRRWGRLHQLPLSSVTAVTTADSKRSRGVVLLSAPGLVKPLRLSLAGRRNAMSSAAREHLRGWLSAPDVQWTPEAKSLFDGDGTRSTSAPGRRRRLLGFALAAGLPLTSLGVGVWLVEQRNALLSIPGVPGYRTFTGPHGKPFAVGRPWGRPCQPVRFTAAEDVPDWVYGQIAVVVAEARRDGIDVTLEDRQSMWSPASLYYLQGQSPASTERVGISPKTRRRHSCRTDTPSTSGWAGMPFSTRMVATKT